MSKFAMQLTMTVRLQLKSHRKEASKFCAWQNGEVSLIDITCAPNPDKSARSWPRNRSKKTLWLTTLQVTIDVIIWVSQFFLSTPLWVTVCDTESLNCTQRHCLCGQSHQIVNNFLYLQFSMFSSMSFSLFVSLCLSS